MKSLLSMTIAIDRHLCIILKGNKSYNKVSEKLSSYGTTAYDVRDNIMDNLFSFFDENNNG